MTNIYTRTGDKGETSLFSGERVLKNNHFIEALGAVDECNSSLGVAISHLQANEKDLKDQLTSIQHALFDVGASLATPLTSSSLKKIEKTRFDEESITELEKWIDTMEDKLVPLKTFILPSGHPSGAMLHFSRALCRRAERMIIPLIQNKQIPNSVLVYLNRLSDYLFVAARFANFSHQVEETHWLPHKVREH